MLRELIDRLPTPSNRAKKIIDRAVEEGNRLREQREKFEEFVLSISLPDYAASEGRNPTDYELRGLHGFGSAESYYQAQTKALVGLNERRIEAGCEVVVGTSFDSTTRVVWGTTEEVEIGASGTGLRLKTG